MLWVRMACILFLATPAAADSGSRYWAWHRKGDELAKTRREQHGLPAPNYGPHELVAAVEVSDFAFIEHRAELETVEHRALANWLLIRHYVPLEDAMFANIRHLYQFGRTSPCLPSWPTRIIHGTNGVLFKIVTKIILWQRLSPTMATWTGLAVSSGQRGRRGARRACAKTSCVSTILLRAECPCQAQEAKATNRGASYACFSNPSCCS